MAFPATSVALLTIASLVSVASAHVVLPENGKLSVGTIAAIVVGSFFLLLILAGCRVRRVHRAATAIKAAINPTRAMPGPPTLLPVVINHAIKHSRSRHWRSPLQHPTALIPGHIPSHASQPAIIAKQQTWLDLQRTVPARDLEKTTLSWSPPPVPWARYPLPGSFWHHGTPAITIQTSHARAAVPKAESEPEDTRVQRHPSTLIPGYRRLHSDKRNLTRQAGGVLQNHTSILGVYSERSDKLAVSYLLPADNPQLMPALPPQLPPPPPGLAPSLPPPPPALSTPTTAAGLHIPVSHLLFPAHTANHLNTY
ncbi:hypothetical protein K438DRAFT_1798717 [Mycena galopus ATCC 62051]|nr:hypothetical protein K438DRAFT_1798717 [Mycena galopus ATCC 62051]